MGLREEGISNPAPPQNPLLHPQPTLFLLWAPCLFIPQMPYVEMLLVHWPVRFTLTYLLGVPHGENEQVEGMGKKPKQNKTKNNQIVPSVWGGRSLFSS